MFRRNTVSISWLATMLVGVFFYQGCKSEEPQKLTVSVGTDLVLGAEFDTILLEDNTGKSIEYLPPSGSRFDTPLVVDEHTFVGANTLKATLLLAKKTQVQRVVEVPPTLKESLTVWLLRSCRGVECEQKESCYSGMCIDRGCIPEEDNTCLEREECERDSDCEADGVRQCIRIRCVNSSCGYFDDNRSCEQNEYCDPALGCQSRDSTNTCTDGMTNGNETGIDCGGDCTGCELGSPCLVDGDCLSNSCEADKCSEGACANGIKDDSETDVDCGGDCAGCVNGKACDDGDDCDSGLCEDNLCVGNASCDDGVKNGAESDVDCGGASCDGCGIGKACVNGGDCESGNCAGELCAEPAPTCNDGSKNGDETDVDCGGSCPKCEIGKSCIRGFHCISHHCRNGRCEPGCFDGIHNGDESDLDCGGSPGTVSESCNRCGNGKRCNDDGDCGSGNCDSGTCRTGISCNDGIKNGDESDVDCGGNTCASCAEERICRTNSDCSNNRCLTNNYGSQCMLATCENGVKDPNETDVDCGGRNCRGCGQGQRCNPGGTDCGDGFICNPNFRVCVMRI